MMNFIQNFGSWLVIGGLAIVGLLFFVGLFDSKRRERGKQENDSEDRLINLLQKEVAELTKKVGQQDKDIKELTAKVQHLETENNTLIKVLQGKDGETQKFYERAYNVMSVAEDTNRVVKAMAEQQTELMRSINTLISKM